MAVAKGTQRTYLKDRLDAINREKGVYGWGDSRIAKLPEPLAVVEAKKRIARDSKIVDRFEKKERAYIQRIKDRKKAMSEDCRRLIEFGDAKDALKAIDKFKATNF